MISLFGGNMKDTKDKLLKKAKLDIDTIEINNTDAVLNVMEIFNNIIEDLEQKKYLPEDLYPTILFLALKEFLANIDDIELGKQMIAFFARSAVDREIYKRNKENNSDPESYDLFNTFQIEDDTIVH